MYTYYIIMLYNIALAVQPYYSLLYTKINILYRKTALRIHTPMLRELIDFKTRLIYACVVIY